MIETSSGGDRRRAGGRAGRWRAILVALSVALAGALSVVVAPGGAAAADEPPADLDLVLAIDCSSSVTADEYVLQMEGFAAAFRDAQVIAAIQAGPHRAVNVAVIEWSYARWQQIVIPWQRVEGRETAEALAQAVQTAPRIVYGGETSISAAIDFSVKLLNQHAPAAGRRVIDVSGDGSNNQGRPAADARDAAVKGGVTINGLTILHEEPDLEAYYRREVMGGPGGFVLPAKDYDAFAEAVREKLLREVNAPVAAAEPQQPSRSRATAFD